MIRTILVVGVALVSVSAAHASEAPWCAMIENGTGSVYWDCQYRSLRLLPQRQYFRRQSWLLQSEPVLRRPVCGAHAVPETSRSPAAVKSTATAPSPNPAASGALVVPIVCLLYRTMFGELVQPVDHLCFAPMLFDQIGQLIVASTSAPLTSHPYGIELADQTRLRRRGMATIIA